MAGQAANAGRWRIGVRGAAALLLLLPAVAMQVTDEVDWDAADFVIFAVMLGAACGGFELAARATRDRAYRAGAAVALASAFVMIWMNLAVGIIGSEDNPANLMYFGVLGIGLVGAVAARFRPRGMAGAMLVTALAQVAAAVAALAAGWGNTLPLTLVFTALWLASAHLFRRAAGAAPA